MANFKGGFAFNNEAAKVEVEQSPNGALISCINPVTGESMGGGNPNSVQVITGTLENPFGDVDLAELLDALNVGADQTGNAHAVIDGDASILGFGHIVEPLIGLNGVFNASGAHVTADSSLCFEFSWNGSDGDFIFAMMEQNGTITNLSAHTSLIPTTLTIYWHPMPEAEGE